MKFSMILLVALALFASVVYADEVHQKVITKELVVVDDQGNSRGGIKVENGKSIIYLADQKETIRSYIAETNGGVILALKDEQGKMKFGVRQGTQGTVSMLLCGTDGQPLLGLTVLEDQKPSIFLFDSNNK